MAARQLLPRPGVEVTRHIVALLQVGAAPECPAEPQHSPSAHWVLTVLCTRAMDGSCGCVGGGRWGAWRGSRHPAKSRTGFATRHHPLLVQEAVRRWCSHVSAGSLWLCVLKDTDSKHRGHWHPADLNLHFTWAQFQKSLSFEYITYQLLHYLTRNLRKTIHSSVTSHSGSDGPRLQKISGNIPRNYIFSECIFISFPLHLRAVLFVSLIYLRTAA